MNELSRSTPIGVTERRAPRAETEPGNAGGTRLWILVFLLPFLVLYGGFTLWPLIATAYYSLFNWDGIQPLTNFVGLGNYQRIWADPICQSSFTRARS